MDYRTQFISDCLKAASHIDNRGIEFKYRGGTELIGYEDVCKCNHGKKSHGLLWCRLCKCKWYRKTGMREWIMPVKTKVPSFWHYCPNMIGKFQCAKPHNVLIFQHGNPIKCRSCEFVSRIIISLPHGHVHEKYIRFLDSYLRLDDGRFAEFFETKTF